MERDNARRPVVHAVAPLRVDLAGGTLDLWPLGLLHPGSATVALAVDLRVAAEARRGPEGRFVLEASDLGARAELSADAPLSERGPLELLERIARLMAPQGGVALSTRSPVRAGSGLGTSSALGIAALGALTRLLGRNLDAGAMVARVRDVEAQVLGIPTGTQDHEAARRGGVVVLRHEPAGPRVQRFAGPLLTALGAHLLVVDSGVARSSGPSNWDMVKRRIEGEGEATRALDEVARAGSEALDALETRSFPKLGAAMRRDVEARARWSPLVVTPPLARILDAARSAGALGEKVCGAGGGGFLVVLAEPGRRARVARAVEEAGGVLSDVGPTRRGLVVEPATVPR